ncbi:MAG: hypothetical protein HC896_01690, partial [Bacteroidales bacterium]|nr:hypothetical protein [Bacteroidales bacterium]
RGGVSFTQGSFYAADGMQARQDPYTWLLNVNANANIYAVVDLPFSITLSKENKTYNQPSFKQIGASPTYKWLTVHAGYRNIQFSQYTLNGISFLGGGVEVNPEKSWIKGKAIYGRFAKGLPYKYNETGIIALPSYSRYGGGAMLTLGNQAQKVDLIVLKLQDDPDKSPKYPIRLVLHHKKTWYWAFLPIWHLWNVSRYMPNMP